LFGFNRLHLFPGQEKTQFSIPFADDIPFLEIFNNLGREKNYLRKEIHLLPISMDLPNKCSAP
jgi:hypothetical protein